MAKCQVCQADVKELDKPGFMYHLNITKADVDNHIHVHGDISNKEIMREMLDAAESEIGIEKSSIMKLEKGEFVFHNRQRIGDILMFTCAIRDFKKAYPDKRVNVISTAGHIWDHNPYIDRSLTPTPENTIKIGPGKGTNMSNRIDWHFANAFRISIEENLGIYIPQGESRPDIWFTQEEYDSPRLFKDPYWVICTTGEKGWGCKMYPQEKWQQFIDQNQDKLFIQIGTAEDNAPRLQGSNVIDYIGKTQSRETGVRDLFKLFLNAEGSVGLVSFHMHLSGALYKPCVVVAGGREPVSFTRYEGHRYLSDDGCLPCSVKACWHCSIDKCTNIVMDKEIKIPKCVDIIDPEDLTRAINLYYRGGRLIKGKAIDKPLPRTPSRFGVNVVATPVIVPVPSVEITETAGKSNTYGMPFGGGSITEQDWLFISSVIDKYKIKGVLEFGAGLSTLLLRDKGVSLITFETNQGWIDKIKGLKSECDLRLWDGIRFRLDNIKSYEMTFVDGPSGGINREFSTKAASDLSDFVIVHDAGREWEKKWQERYLVPRFDGPIKGGHRCHLWIRKDKVVPQLEIKDFEIKGIKTNLSSSKEGVNDCGYMEDGCVNSFIKEPPVDAEKPNPPEFTHTFPTSVNSKYIKVVSTARGWGGCARSVTTIMKMLADNGHKVEFIPFRNSVGSREFKEFLSSDCGITVTEHYNSLRESCDVLLMYADDYVWEFSQPEIVEAFSNIGAEYKVMMLNYRRGKVGVVDWTKGWDKYMFLCSWQERDLLNIMPGIKTKVLPPCTNLTEFLNVTPNYYSPNMVRIVRHSSQGDTKFPTTFGEEVIQALNCREDLAIAMLPGPSFVNFSEPLASRFLKLQKTSNAKEIAEFLSTGNLFWYSVPPKYMDMGPRVIVEAMACGLPVIADNWIGGPSDRITKETGWLCSTKEQHIEIMKNISLAELEKMGKAARERAYQEFRPEAWLRELIN